MIDATAEETYLSRPAIRFNTFAVCPAFLHPNSPNEDLFAFGDRQEMVVDLETGVLLERTILLGGEVADFERVTFLEAETRRSGRESS